MICQCLVILTSLYVGTGICRDCRPIIDATDRTPIREPGTPSIADITEDISDITLVSFASLVT